MDPSQPQWEMAFAMMRTTMKIACLMGWIVVESMSTKTIVWIAVATVHTMNYIKVPYARQ